MSSKRGRKRNDSLPPNRARDVQRAFRARRAAHLQALEQRVSELEEENLCLRQALHLPPANRPPLGRGPTGKDKPKPLEPRNVLPHLFSGQDSSSAESPDSTRTGSLSPSQMVPSAPSASSRQICADMDGPWEQSLVLAESPSDVTSSSASSSYPISQMPSPVAPKPNQYSSYPSPLPPAPQNVPNPVFLNSQPAYSHTADRPMSAHYGTTSFVMNNDVHDERQYSYSQSAYGTQESTMPLSPRMSTGSIHHPVRVSQTPVLPPRPESVGLPFPRRSLTEPHAFPMKPEPQTYPTSQVYHLPSLMPHHHIKLPSPPMHEVAPAMIPQNYGVDGRLSMMT